MINPRTKKGFTMIELLIGIVLFVIFLGVVTNSYIDIVRAQRSANEVRKMYSQVRDFVDFLSQEVRLSSIDYGCYLGGGQGSSTCGGADGGSSEISGLFDVTCPKGSLQISNGRSADLSVTRKDGLTKTIFHYDADAKKVQVVQFDANMEGGGWKDSVQFPGQEYKDVFDGTIIVEKLTFAISPDVNPYGGEYYCLNQKQFQPKVTVFMQLRNSNSVSSDFSFDYQTTISSRVYSES